MLYIFYILLSLARFFIRLTQKKICNYNMKIIISLLFLFPVFCFAQNHGNFKIDANKRYVYEKVFDAPGLSKEKIQPMLISKVSAIKGVNNVVGANAIVTGEYVNTSLVFNSKKTAIGEFADAVNHFYGKIKIDIKDNKYRVQITNMKTIVAGTVFSLEEFAPSKKRTHIVIQKLDTYFTNYYTLNASDDW